MWQGLGEEGQGLWGMMGAEAKSTLGEENWGGRIVHLNMKLITCKYNANDMQMSIGFLWVHSSSILFLGLSIGANLHSVLGPVPCFFIIHIFRGRTQISLVKGVVGPTWAGPLDFLEKGKTSGKSTCLSDSE